MKDTNELLYPGRRFIKESKRNYENWSNNKEAVFILLHGIVIDIFLENDQKDRSHIVPPYSLNLRIIGEDITDKNAKDIVNKPPKWYAPLLPNNFLILPEIGEEVLVMREFNSKRATGYWLCRINDSSYVTRNLTRSWTNSAVPQLRYAFPFSVEELSENTENKTPKKEFESIDLKPGDIAIRGRCGSYCIHSYKDNNALLTTGIIDKTRTSHYESSSILKSLEKENIEFSDEEYEDVESSLILNVADKFVSYSAYSEGNNVLYKQVKGEKLNEVILVLIEELRETKKTVQSLVSKSNENETRINRILTRLESIENKIKTPEEIATESKPVVSPTYVQAQAQADLLAEKEIEEVKTKLDIVEEELDILSENHFIN